MMELTGGKIYRIHSGNSNITDVDDTEAYVNTSLATRANVWCTITKLGPHNEDRRAVGDSILVPVHWIHELPPPLPFIEPDLTRFLEA